MLAAACSPLRQMTNGLLVAWIDFDHVRKLAALGKVRNDEESELVNGSVAGYGESLRHAVA